MTEQITGVNNSETKDGDERVLSRKAETCLFLRHDKVTMPTLHKLREYLPEVACNPFESTFYRFIFPLIQNCYQFFNFLQNHQTCLAKLYILQIMSNEISHYLPHLLHQALLAVSEVLLVVL